jgi:hypothetical protein
LLNVHAARMLRIRRATVAAASTTATNNFEEG